MLKKSFINASNSYVDDSPKVNPAGKLLEPTSHNEIPLEENKSLVPVDSLEDEVGSERESDNDTYSIPKTPGSDFISKSTLEGLKPPVKKATTAPVLKTAGPLEDESEREAEVKAKVPKTNETHLSPFMKGDGRIALTEGKVKENFA